MPLVKVEKWLELLARGHSCLAEAKDIKILALAPNNKPYFLLSRFMIPKKNSENTVQSSYKI